MGHLDGGHERDVRIESYVLCSHSPSLCIPALGRSRHKVRSNCHCGLLSSSYTRECVTASLGAPIKNKMHSSCRDYVDFTVPPPFSSRVRNALNAEAKSVRLSALVGAGGHWYGFGKIIMRL